MSLRTIAYCAMIVGIVNLGEIYNDMQTLQTGEQVDAQVATHLLQFMFIGSTGLKYPVAYYPTIEVDPITLYHKFWDIVFLLGENGFKVLMAICDGAQANRTSIQSHFVGVDAIAENFTTTNIYTGEHLVFIVDPSNYQVYLNINNKDGSILDKTIELLEVTSTLIKNSKNKKLYRSLEDERFSENQLCLQWIKKCEEQVLTLTSVTPRERNKMFLSEKTKYDVYSMIVGFKAYCDCLFLMYPGSSTSSYYTNQDQLENFFGEQRACNGQATNPTILQTEHSTSGIIQMQQYAISKGNCQI